MFTKILTKSILILKGFLKKAAACSQATDIAVDIIDEDLKKLCSNFLHDPRKYK
jgi:hypothetical protein